MNIDLHPLCTLFPRVTGREFDELVADIKANGLREPITTKNGMILDGGNRYAACKVAGIEPATIEYSGSDIAAFVLSKNLHRRHMTEGQRAAIVSSAQNWEASAARGGDRKSDQSARVHFDSAADRAAVAGVSLRTQKKADKITKSNPEKAAEVARGEKTLNEAIKEIAPDAASNISTKKPEAKTDSLQAKYDELRDRYDDLALSAKEFADQVQTIDAIKAGETEVAKEMNRLRAQVRSLEEVRDRLITTNAEQVRQIKGQQKTIAKLEAQIAEQKAVAEADF